MERGELTAKSDSGMIVSTIKACQEMKLEHVSPLRLGPAGGEEMN